MGQALALSAFQRPFSASRAKSQKSTWAAYVKDRWPHYTVQFVQEEWGLPPHTARSVVNGEISQATIDHILKHRRGGALLAFEIVLLQFDLTCQQFADKLEAEAEIQRRTIEDRAAPKRRVALRLAPDPVEDRSFAPLEKRGRG